MFCAQSTIHLSIQSVSKSNAVELSEGLEGGYEREDRLLKQRCRLLVTNIRKDACLVSKQKAPQAFVQSVIAPNIHIFK